MTQQTVHASQRHPTQVGNAEKAQGRGREIELPFVIVLAAVYLAWFAWPLIWSGSANVRLVGTFNTDEEAHVILLKEAIDSRFPRLGYIQYGYAYLNMGLVPLFLLSFVTEVSEQHIIVWLRMIPALFAVATIALTFIMARHLIAHRFFGRLTAWLAAFLLLFTVLNFLQMSAMSHSDIPQVFFLMAGVYCCSLWARDGRLKWLVWASALAGLAFGCKYSGLFLLPIIGLYGILGTIRMDQSQVIVNSGQVIMLGRLLSTFAGLALLVLGFVLVPYVSHSYAGAEYFGVSLESFFGSLRTLAIAAGIVMLALAAVPFLWAFIRSRRKLAYLLMLGIVSAIAFGAAFFLSSPFNVFSVRSGFARGFFYESLHSSFGHSFEAQSGRLEWFSVLSSPELLDPLVLGLAAVSLLLAVYRTVRRGWQQLLEPESVFWVWTLCYLVFLVWRVNIRGHRTLLPIVPFLLIFAAHTVGQFTQLASYKLPRRFAVALTIASLLIVVGLELPTSLNRALEFRRVTGAREQTSEAVLVGHWLAGRYPPSTRVLYDPFNYVPPVFADAFVTPWGGTLQMLETLQPDIVIVNQYTSAQFSDIQQADKYARDKAHFMEKYDYYAALRSGEEGYALVGDFGEIQVYARIEARGCRSPRLT